MEKRAVEQKRRRRHRLLIAALAAVLAPLSAQSLSSDDIRALSLVPQDGTVFVGQPCTFTLVLHGIDPSLARAELPDFPPNVRFVSSKKETLYDAGGNAGTKFLFQLLFSAAGTPRLPPLPVYVRRRAYAIPFAPVTVYEDPATLLPRLSVAFETQKGRAVPQNGAVAVAAGETVRCTLYAQHCTQLLHFSWDLPKDAIFAEAERFPLARGEPLSRQFSPDLIPVARFDWMPLVAGDYDFPPFAVEATAYNGSRVAVTLPAYRLTVRPADTVRTDAAQSERRNDVFAAAFQPPPPGEADAPVQDETAQTESVSLHAGKTLARVLLAAAAMFAVLAVAALCFRRRLLPVPLALALVFLLAFVWAREQSARSYAVFRGGAVSPVPDAAATSVLTMPNGVRVRVLERAGDWAYIAGGEVAGWVRAESLEDD